MFNVQGKLADGQGNPISGSRVVTFRLYNNAGDPIATRVWEESLGVDFNSGLFNVALGSGTSLDAISFDKPYYLGMQVAGDDNEMAPRQLLGASAYALGSLGDFNVKKVLYTGSIQSPTTGQALILQSNGGNVGIGTATPGTIFQISKDNDFVRLNRSSTNKYLGLSYATNSTDKWFVGLREVYGNNSLSIYGFAGGADAVTIQENGNVGIGAPPSTDGPAYSTRLVVGGADWGIKSSGGSVGAYATGGNVDFHATIGGGIDFYSPSSLKWKENIVPIDHALDKVMKLRGVSYNWKKEYGGKRDTGMIAEEVAKVLPDITAPDPYDKTTLGIDYSRLTVVLVEAVKELNAKWENAVQELKAENELLKKRVTALEQ